MGRNDLYSEISCTEFPSKGLEFEIHLTRIIGKGVFVFLVMEIWARLTQLQEG